MVKIELNRDLLLKLHGVGMTQCGQILKVSREPAHFTERHTSEVAKECGISTSAAQALVNECERMTLVPISDAGIVVKDMVFNGKGESVPAKPLELQIRKRSKAGVLHRQAVDRRTVLCTWVAGVAE